MADLTTLEYEVLGCLAGEFSPLEQRGWVNRVLADLQGAGLADAAGNITAEGRARFKSAEVAQALDVAECKVNAPSGTLNTNGESKNG